jgi:hypothetical protein
MRGFAGVPSSSTFESRIPKRQRSRIGAEGGRMTRIWGLSKKEANYGPAPTPEVRCDRCMYMGPRLAIGGCRFVRGVIHGSDNCKEFRPQAGASGTSG